MSTIHNDIINVAQLNIFLVPWVIKNISFFSPSAYQTFVKTDHIFGCCKKSPFQKMEMLETEFSDYSVIKLDINKKNFVKIFRPGKLFKSMLVNNFQAKVER